MATKKMDLWKLVQEAGIPDELTVDPIEVLYCNRMEGPLFDEQDEKERDKYGKAYDKRLSKLEVTLSDEQKKLFFKVDSALADISSVQAFSSYKHGFRDGVILMFNTLLNASMKDTINKAIEGELKDKVVSLAK